MSPIQPDSELGRLIAIKKELENLFKLTLLIIQLCSSNTNNAIIKLKIKLLVANIKRVKILRIDYLQLVERDRQDFNEELNSINTIISSGETIKNVRVNSRTLDSLIDNLRSLSQHTTAAIIQTANHVLILDTRDRIALASSHLPSRPSRFPSIPSRFPSIPSLPLPPPPPFSAPPRLQRQPNIGTHQRGLVRQEATRSLLEDLDVLAISRESSSSSQDHRDALGKQLFKRRRPTRRKRGTKRNILRVQKPRNHYKTRRRSH
jgi:hypothetical protein